MMTTAEELALEELLDGVPLCQWNHLDDEVDTGIPTHCSEIAVALLVDCEDSMLICAEVRWSIPTSTGCWHLICGRHGRPDHVTVVSL